MRGTPITVIVFGFTYPFEFLLISLSFFWISFTQSIVFLSCILLIILFFELSSFLRNIIPFFNDSIVSFVVVCRSFFNYGGPQVSRHKKNPRHKKNSRHKKKTRHKKTGSALWSDSPLVRQPVGPTARWSDNPLVRQPVGPTTRWSDSPLVRHIILELFLDQTVLIV